MSATDSDKEPSTDSAPVANVIPLTQRPELEQAKLFAKLLRRDIATMKRKVRNAESAWRRRCESQGRSEPPERLALVRERLTDAQRMLSALNARFPKS
jgi:hypothetical protein